MDPPQPETAQRVLTIAIVGRCETGKTSLKNHLSAALSPQTQLVPMPRRDFTPQVRHASPNRRVSLRSRTQHTIRSRWSLVCKKIRSFFSSPTEEQVPSFTVFDVPAPENSVSCFQMWRIVDVTGPGGIFKMSQHVCPDIILYVTRLDDSRAEKRDYMGMREISIAFGDEAMCRTIFVLTHGQSLAPVNLTYEEYLRGRRDALWRYVSLNIPPVPREPRDADTSDGTEAASGSPRGTTNGHGRGFAESLSRLGEFRRVIDSSVPVNKPDPIDEMVFDDPPPPEIAVVELSEHCAKDEYGNKILPDGTDWMKELLMTIEKVVVATIGENTNPLRSIIFRGPRVRVGKMEMISRFARRGIGLFALEFALSVVLFRAFHLWIAFWKQREERIRESRSDTILELSDEEYNRLTVEDIEPDPRLSEGYDKAENYFFGDEDVDDDVDESSEPREPPPAQADPPNSDTSQSVA